MPHMLIFGLGYTAGRIAARLRNEGWRVTGTSRGGRDGTLCFDDHGAIARAIGSATHILSSVPPVGDADIVLDRHGSALAAAGKWLGYLSSTGVHGDTGGAWVDEASPIGEGRRGARVAADRRWQAVGAHVFRLPGIYGPGRSVFDRLRDGRARRIDLADQVFSRVHVDDIVSGVIAALPVRASVFNLADDEPCSQNEVIEFACRLAGLPLPPLQPLAEAQLSPMALGFYAENRRVANGKAKRMLGWRPVYPDYRVGLRAVSAITSPVSASTAPPAASGDQ